MIDMNSFYLTIEQLLADIYSNASFTRHWRHRLNINIVYRTSNEWFLAQTVQFLYAIGRNWS